jgi:hypothetical protein
MAEDLQGFANGEKITIAYLGGKKDQKRSGDFILDYVRRYFPDDFNVEFVNIGNSHEHAKMNTRAMGGKINKLAYIDDWTNTGSQFNLTFSPTGGTNFLERVKDKMAFFVASSHIAEQEIEARSLQEQTNWKTISYIRTKTVGEVMTENDLIDLQTQVPDGAGWSGWRTSALTFSFWKAPDNMPKLFTGKDDYLKQFNLNPIIDIHPPYYRKNIK